MNYNKFSFVISSNSIDFSNYLFTEFKNHPVFFVYIRKRIRVKFGNFMHIKVLNREKNTYFGRTNWQKT